MLPDLSSMIEAAKFEMRKHRVKTDFRITVRQYRLKMLSNYGAVEDS